VKALSSLALVVASLGVAVACGGDASTDCEKIVDAFANAWQRCMRASYSDAQKTFSDALQCGKVKSSKGDQVSACVNDLNMLDCNSVTSGVSPAPCTNALSE